MQASARWAELAMLHCRCNHNTELGGFEEKWAHFLCVK